MILIIGYGNPLRSDDSIGQKIAQTMKDRLNRSDVEVLLTHQLTPELVYSVSQSRLVVFIDARMGDQPGEVIHEVIEPQPGTGIFTHDVTPMSLLAGAHELYGALPDGIMISIVGAGFDYGCELSPGLQQALPHIADGVKAIIESSANVQIYEEADHA
jgi:hydrogenase maturation protease